MMPSPVPEDEAGVPPEGATPSPPRRRLRAVLLGVLAVVLAGGGAAAAGIYFGWFGGSGGTHPYDVMPASTIGYVQLDLNPSLAQKTQAWAFLRDLPEVQASPMSQPDPKGILWNLRERLWVGSTWTDYDTDLTPWLGDRIGVGLLPNPTDPNHEAVWITAIQVTDAAKATAKLQEWLDATENPYEVSTRDGYALITAKSTASFVHEEQAKGVLGANQRFRGDLASVGETGWMAGWLDSGQLAANSDVPSDEPGREAFALRFSADTMEFVGRTLDTNHPLVNGSGQLGTLPATTGTAACVTGAIKGVPPLPFPLPMPRATRPWPGDALNAADTAALLGKGVCVTSPESEVPGLFPSAPKALGLRVVADDPGRAREVLHTVSSDILPGHQLVADQVDGNVLTAATSGDYLADLAGTGDPLSGHEVFTRAVPESARAALAFYLNLESFGSRFVEAGSPYEPFATSIKAVGGQYFDEGSGNGAWSVRVVRA